jgi:hypothetical protein
VSVASDTTVGSDGLEERIRICKTGTNSWLRNRPEFVAGIDFLKRCDTAPGTPVLPAVGNPRDDCVGIVPGLKYSQRGSQEIESQPAAPGFPNLRLGHGELS